MGNSLHKISAYYKENFNLPGIQVIKDPSVRSSGLIFTKFSPISRIFHEFGIKCFDNGLYGRLIMKWFGKNLHSPEPNNKTVLSLHHTLAGFIIITFAFIMSLFVLGIEFVCKYINN